jgi:hypothetical protein
MDGEGGFPDLFLVVEVASLGEVVLEVTHVVLGLEINSWMERKEFGATRRRLNEPVASSSKLI